MNISDTITKKQIVSEGDSLKDLWEKFSTFADVVEKY